MLSLLVACSCSTRRALPTSLLAQLQLPAHLMNVAAGDTFPLAKLISGGREVGALDPAP